MVIRGMIYAFFVPFSAVKGYFLPHGRSKDFLPGKNASLAFGQFYHGHAPRKLPDPPLEYEAPFLEVGIGEIKIWRGWHQVWYSIAKQVMAGLMCTRNNIKKELNNQQIVDLT